MELSLGQLIAITIGTIVMIVISEYIMRSGTFTARKCPAKLQEGAPRAFHLKYINRYLALGIIRLVACYVVAEAATEQVGWWLVAYFGLLMVTEAGDAHFARSQCPCGAERDTVG